MQGSEEEKQAAQKRFAEISHGEFATTASPQIPYLQTVVLELLAWQGNC